MAIENGITQVGDGEDLLAELLGLDDLHQLAVFDGEAEYAAVLAIRTAHQLLLGHQSQRMHHVHSLRRQVGET